MKMEIRFFQNNSSVLSMKKYINNLLICYTIEKNAHYTKF